MSPRRLLLSAFAVALCVGFATSPALAAAPSSPYPSTGFGYDVSYPQCGTGLPGDGAFGIVGVGGGRPFTTNSCLQSEYQWAASKEVAPSLYVNTGYAGAYGRHITDYCSSHAPQSLTAATSGRRGKPTKGGGSSLLQAWEIGCSEADTAIGAASSETGSALPEMWWLDVETGNSWSSSSYQLNAETLQGLADRLNGAGGMTSAPSLTGYVGVYSDAYMWGRIDGTQSVTGIVAGWNADDGNNCNNFLAATTGATTWLQQHVVTLDEDSSC